MYGIRNEIEELETVRRVKVLVKIPIAKTIRGILLAIELLGHKIELVKIREPFVEGHIRQTLDYISRKIYRF